MEALQPTDHIGVITHIIDQALAELYPVLSLDIIAEEVYHALAEGVTGGWCSQAEAEERYASWWQQYHLPKTL